MDNLEHTLLQVQEDAAEVLDLHMGGLYHIATERVSEDTGKRVCFTIIHIRHLINRLSIASAFFGFLASFMLPANMPVQLFLFVSV